MQKNNPFGCDVERGLWGAEMELGQQWGGYFHGWLSGYGMERTDGFQEI